MFTRIIVLKGRAISFKNELSYYSFEERLNDMLKERLGSDKENADMHVIEKMIDLLYE